MFTSEAKRVCEQLVMHSYTNMWCGKIILTVLCALTLVSHSQDIEKDVTTTAPGSEKCVSSSFENGYYNCDGVVVRVLDVDDMVVVDCDGQLLDCSKLQSFPYRGGKDHVRLRVRNCIVNSSLECLLPSLSATGASTLFLDNVFTELTEESVRGLDMLTAFFVYNGIETTVPVDILKRLPNLKMHRLHNDKISSLAPNTFNQPGIPELATLEISTQNITTLPADAFNGLKTLGTLYLFKNNFQDLDVNSFRGLDSLKDLNMDGNNISVLLSGLFLNAPLLTSLSVLRNNQDLRVQAGAISGLAHLKKLELSSYKELRLDPASLSNLPSLTTLKLDDSGITELPADLLVNTTAVVNLTLSNNNLRYLPESVFSSLRELKKLDLSKNKLERVTATDFKSLVKLETLNLNGNFIETLPENLFFSSALTTVSIAHNRIVDINPKTFFGAERSITSLELSHNRLAWDCFATTVQTDTGLMDGEGAVGYIQIPLQSPLHLLDSLEHLNLSHNNLSNLCSDFIEIMTRLKVLNLSFNALTKITQADLNFVSKDIKVDLRGNNITTVEVPTYTVNKPNLLLGGNPFHCDCHLYQFLNELKNLPYDVEGASCHQPPSLNGVPLRSGANEKLSSSVSLSSLTCPLPDTPANCSCVVRPAEFRTECDCSDIKNNSLPIPVANNGWNISQMMLTLQTVSHIALIPKFVTKLNLSNLGLKTVPNIPVTVTHVDLSNNTLSSVPLKFLKRNITLKLGGNPLKCDCWRTEDVKNLQRYHSKIENYDSLLCTDSGYVRQVYAERLCDVIRASIIGTSLAVFGLIVAVAITLAYKYSLKIKVYLYNLGWTWIVKDDALDTDKIYDVFISYYNADEKFVKKTLCPELEKDYKVCIHSRDWDVGGKIASSICTSVSQSKRTLIVISKALLSAPQTWVYFELEAAIAQSAMDQRPRAVVVVIDDDVKFENAPDVLKNYVKTYTYIKWGESLFWERLRYALPKKKLGESDVKKAKRRAVKSLGNGALNVVINENGELMNVPALNSDASIYIKVGDAPNGNNTSV